MSRSAGKGFVMFDDTLISKFDVVATAYCVYAYRGNQYVLDFPQMFVERDDAVHFMKENYGTDIKPATDGRCDLFTDSNGNYFYIGIINTYGKL